jgi:thiol:disulfide interchange protein DsbD
MIQGLAESLQQRPLLAVATLFGAGVLTSLTPCIYPMIPISAAVISGTTGERASRLRTFGLTLTYVLGLALLYATVGLIAGLTGSLFGTIAASPWALWPPPSALTTARRVTALGILTASCACAGLILAAAADGAGVAPSQFGRGGGRARCRDRAG